MMKALVPRIAPSEITPQQVYLNRRTLLAGALASGASTLLRAAEAPAPPGAPLTYTHNGQYSVKEPPNKLEDIAGYNNFYEFGTDKSIWRDAQKLEVRPWTIKVSGMVEKPFEIGIDDLLSKVQLEERVYRHRCVEGWSMVIPWAGFSLANLIKEVQPTGNAKFVEFVTLADPKQMPGINAGYLK